MTEQKKSELTDSEVNGPVGVYQVLLAKLDDAEVSGYEVEFSQHEAELLGAFQEDALDFESAKAGAVDSPDVIATAKD